MTLQNELKIGHTGTYGVIIGHTGTYGVKIGHAGTYGVKIGHTGTYGFKIGHTGTVCEPLKNDLKKTLTVSEWHGHEETE